MSASQTAPSYMNRVWRITLLSR